MTKKNEIIMDFIDYCLGFYKLDFYETSSDGECYFQGLHRECNFQGIYELLDDYIYDNQEDKKYKDDIKTFLDERLPKNRNKEGYIWEKTKEGVNKRIDWLKKEKNEFNIIIKKEGLKQINKRFHSLLKSKQYISFKDTN